MLAQFVTPKERRIGLILLGGLLCLAALVTLIVAVERLPPGNTQVRGFAVAYADTEAAARGWPASTPHTQPWPPPTYWNRVARWGIRYFYVVAADPGGRNGFSMKLSQSGWPLPVAEVRELWWNTEDPELAGPKPGASTRVLYRNLTFDAFVLGGATWFVLALIYFAAVIAPRVRRELRAREKDVPLFSRSEVRFVTMVLIIFLCLAATLETSFAWSKYRRYRNDSSKLDQRYWIDENDEEPVPGWPVRPPAKWEQPNVWMANRTWGVNNYLVLATDEAQVNQFSAEVWLYGWPFAALQDLRFGWPVIGGGRGKLDPPLRPHLFGLAMNAAVLGAGPLLLVGGPVMGLIAWRRIRTRLSSTEPIRQPPHISTRARVRNRVALAGALIALAAAVNVPLALVLAEFYSGPRRVSAGGPFNEVRVQDAEAAAYGWPSAFPPGAPWPPPHLYSRESRIGVTAYNVNGPAIAGASRGFVMNIDRYGWPLRVIEDKWMGWDTAAPGMQRSDFHPAPALLTRSLILNPIILGGGAFLLLIVPLGALRTIRTRRRAKQGRCIACGYDIKNLSVCPECGRANESVGPAPSR